jgi:hypothetical protein
MISELSAVQALPGASDRRRADPAKTAGREQRHSKPAGRRSQRIATNGEHRPIAVGIRTGSDRIRMLI